MKQADVIDFIVASVAEVATSLHIADGRFDLSQVDTQDGSTLVTLRPSVSDSPSAVMDTLVSGDYAVASIDDCDAVEFTLDTTEDRETFTSLVGAVLRGSVTLTEYWAKGRREVGSIDWPGHTLAVSRPLLSVLSRRKKVIKRFAPYEGA